MKYGFSDEDWKQHETNWMSWWGQSTDRPLIMAYQHKPTDRVRPSWWGGKFGRMPFDVPVEAIADEIWDDIGRTTYCGDAWPRTWIDFGPGIAAAFLGGDVDPSTGTLWFYPGIWKNKPLREIKPTYDPNNRWWNRVQDLTRACLEKFDGHAQVGFTDIGGNLDTAASLRETEPLLMDCLDDPEGVDELCRQITPLWLRYFREQVETITPAGRGTSSWAALWSAQRTYMLQSDFSYMISPSQFERWVAPDVATCCKNMEHGFYHLDGKGELPHLDILLSIPELKGVQWIPGDGQPPSTDPVWWPVLKRIRNAGKLVQLYAPAESVLAMAKEVSLKGFAIEIGTGNSGHEAELVERIQKENAAVRARASVSV